MVLGVLHHARHVPFRVGELGHLAHVRNERGGRAELAAGRFDRGHAFGDRTHGDGDAKRVERALGRGAAALGDEAVRET
jgi:hypothetical protein